MSRTLVLMAVLVVVSSPIAAQGPPPAGIRAEIVNAERAPARALLKFHRRSTPVGRGALIGAIAGAAFGYLGTTEALRGHGDAGLDRPTVVIGFAAIGAGIGALVAHIINDH